MPKCKWTLSTSLNFQLLIGNFGGQINMFHSYLLTEHRLWNNFGENPLVEMNIPPTWTQNGNGYIPQLERNIEVHLLPILSKMFQHYFAHLRSTWVRLWRGDLSLDEKLRSEDNFRLFIYVNFFYTMKFFPFVYYLWIYLNFLTY